MKAKIVLLETKVESQLVISPIVPTSASPISYSHAVKQTSSIPAAESSLQVKSKIPNPSKIDSSDSSSEFFNFAKASFESPQHYPVPPGLAHSFTKYRILSFHSRITLEHTGQTHVLSAIFFLFRAKRGSNQITLRFWREKKRSGVQPHAHINVHGI